jgi:hypothetical protein
MRRSFRSLRGRGPMARAAVASAVLAAGIAVAVPASAAAPPQITLFGAAYRAMNGDLSSYTAHGVIDDHVSIAAGTTPGFSLNPATGQRAMAWQGGNGKLWVDTGTGPQDTGLAMAPGTSPVVSVFYKKGVFVVFQASNGQLWDDLIGSGAWPVIYQYPGPVAPGTSPSLAVNPATGTYQVAWQGPDNNLWLINDKGWPIDTALAMDPGTSPALAMIPGTTGNYEIAYTTRADTLAVYGTSGNQDLGQPVAPGTSPAIDPASSGFRIGWHGNDGFAHITSDTGPQNLKIVMAPGTSPSVAEAPGDSHVAMAFQASGNGLWITGDTGTTIGINMPAGTSPLAFYCPF